MMAKCPGSGTLVVCSENTLTSIFCLYCYKKIKVVSLPHINPMRAYKYNIEEHDYEHSN